MKRTHQQYTKSFKLEVVEEVLSGRMSKEAARKKYGIRAKSGILHWMRKLGVSGERTIPVSFEEMKKEHHSDSAVLKQRVKELERSLEEARLQAEGYSRMIDIAERELKITIRKKSSTKQSEK